MTGSPHRYELNSIVFEFHRLSIRVTIPKAELFFSLSYYFLQHLETHGANDDD